MESRRKNTALIAIIGLVAVMVILLLGTLWTGRSARKDTEEAVRAVSLLYLEPAFRGKGHGIQLLERADRFYRLQGRQSLRLLVAESNWTARAFYEREGFRRIGEENGSTGKLLRLERPIPAAGDPD